MILPLMNESNLRLEDKLVWEDLIYSYNKNMRSYPSSGWAMGDPLEFNPLPIIVAPRGYIYTTTISSSSGGCYYPVPRSFLYATKTNA